MQSTIPHIQSGALLGSHTRTHTHARVLKTSSWDSSHANKYSTFPAAFIFAPCHLLGLCCPVPPFLYSLFSGRLFQVLLRRLTAGISYASGKKKSGHRKLDGHDASRIVNSTQRLLCCCFFFLCQFKEALTVKRQLFTRGIKAEHIFK